jgi:hypothetical protein
MVENVLIVDDPLFEFATCGYGIEFGINAWCVDARRNTSANARGFILSIFSDFGFYGSGYIPRFPA